MDLGMCSVTFRQLPPEEIIRLAADAGLACIEWGSDVHAPCHDTERLRRIADMQRQAGLFCSSYGTYFRIGQNPSDEFRACCEAAGILGTDVLRVWCGSKNAADTSAEETEMLFAECRRIADIAAAYGMTVCCECHGGTYTETAEGALALMRAVDSPHFRMYWQPNQYRTPEENLRYARLIGPCTVHLHVFQWKGEERFSLRCGSSEWCSYLACFRHSRAALLEFMPDGAPGTLAAEAAALREIRQCAKGEDSV